MAQEDYFSRLWEPSLKAAVQRRDCWHFSTVFRGYPLAGSLLHLT